LTRRQFGNFAGVGTTCLLITQKRLQDQGNLLRQIFLLSGFGDLLHALQNEGLLLIARMVGVQNSPPRLL
jgi:hypothetical protein